MLVLMRRLGESILIGDDIKITLVDSRSTQAKIGIEAPKSVVILREELIERDKERAGGDVDGNVADDAAGANRLVDIQVDD